MRRGWPARLAAVAGRLREVLPLAEELGLTIAMENHQDATTADLLSLHEMSGNSPAYGITFDTGNPLAMGEDPLEAARALAPLIRHVHLKDYSIHFAPEGYRLVRCAAGDGVIDFPAILRMVGANGHHVVPGIEIAAQAMRTIPILDPGWWTTYPNRDARDLVALCASSGPKAAQRTNHSPPPGNVASQPTASSAKNGQCWLAALSTFGGSCEGSNERTKK